MIELKRDISTGQLGLLVGKVKSGKGVLISNLLMNKNFYKDQFDMVYIISPTTLLYPTSKAPKPTKYLEKVADRSDDELTSSDEDSDLG